VNEKLAVLKIGSKTSVILLAPSFAHNLGSELEGIPMVEFAQYSARVRPLKDAVKAGLLKRARRIQAVADALDDRAATRQVHELREKYGPLVAKAEQDQDWNEQQKLLSEWEFDSDSVLDPVYERKGERLSAEARKYGITVSPKPRNNDERSDDWRLSRIYGFWMPSVPLEQRLRSEIRSERRASYDEFRKWATLSFAVAGFLLAFYSVRVAKQPDPCARNYYRNDSGQCVFALDKIAQPAKPSPSKEIARAKR
jgi:hypothetical protein